MLKRLLDSLQRNGVAGTAQAAKNKLHDLAENKRKRDLFAEYQNLFNENGLNICQNSSIPGDYDPSLDNILLATESPYYVHNGYSEESSGWIEDHMEFVAEVSWEQYTDCDLHYCPRALYSTNDNYVNLRSDFSASKEDLVSLTYSDKTYAPGHKFRHEVVDEIGEKIDYYGSGTGTPLAHKRESLDSYRFHVVINNVSHPDLLSEKFFDPVKTRTVPICWGGSRSIETLGFDLDGMFFFSTIDELDDILDELSPARYEDLRPSVEYNRDRLIEIRNRQKIEYYLSSIQHSYMWFEEENYGFSQKSFGDILDTLYSGEYPTDLNLKPDGPQRTGNTER